MRDKLSGDDIRKAHAIANFLFPKEGEWEFYVSPKGYKFLKIKQKKEHAA